MIFNSHSRLSLPRYHEAQFCEGPSLPIAIMWYSFAKTVIACRYPWQSQNVNCLAALELQQANTTDLIISKYKRSTYARNTRRNIQVRTNKSLKELLTKRSLLLILAEFTYHKLLCVILTKTNQNEKCIVRLIFVSDQAGKCNFRACSLTIIVTRVISPLI